MHLSDCESSFLLYVSIGTCMNALKPNTLRFDKFGFSPNHISAGVILPMHEVSVVYTASFQKRFSKPSSTTIECAMDCSIVSFFNSGVRSAHNRFNSRCRYALTWFSYRNATYTVRNSSRIHFSPRLCTPHQNKSSRRRLIWSIGHHHAPLVLSTHIYQDHFSNHSETINQNLYTNVYVVSALLLAILFQNVQNSKYINTISSLARFLTSATFSAAFVFCKK